ncbi:serine hydrolase, partial [Hydrotalea sp.]
MPKLFYTISLLLFSFVAQSQSEQQKKVLVHSIDSIIQSQVQQQLIPGAVVLIKKDGKVVYQQAYGYARLYSRDHQLLAKPEKMQLNTMFDLASLTKVVGTTTAIMYLVDQHLLSVDDPVAKYVAAFNTSDKNSITIKNLLTHTSGIDEWYPLFYRANNRQQVFSLIAQLPLRYPIGVQRKYSDLGFTILGEIIQVVSGMPFEQFEQEKIFKPLQMLHTTYNPLKTGKFTHFAATSFGNPYEKRMVYDSTLGFTYKEINPQSWNGWRNYVLNGEVNDGNAWYANGGVSGAAGIFSTADDIQKLVDMLMNEGKVSGMPFISDKTLQTFFTKDTFLNGLGWMMDTHDSFMKNAPEGSFGHTGFTGTSIVVVPQYHTSIILLINRQHMGLLPTGKYYDVSPIR